MSFSLKIETAEQLAEAALASSKEEARRSLVSALVKAADAVTGPVPQAERDSWATKAVAARAVLDGSAGPDQVAMLAAEAALTDEAQDVLAARIVAKADAYSTFAATLAGLRRTTLAAVEAATTPEDVQATLNGLQAALSPN